MGNEGKVCGSCTIFGIIRVITIRAMRSLLYLHKFSYLHSLRHTNVYIYFLRARRVHYNRISAIMAGYTPTGSKTLMFISADWQWENGFGVVHNHRYMWVSKSHDERVWRNCRAQDSSSRGPVFETRLGQLVFLF